MLQMKSLRVARNKNLHWVAMLQAEKVGVQLSIAGGGRQRREVTESRTETELRVDEAETRQTSTGRPLRECREKVGFNYAPTNS